MRLEGERLRLQDIHGEGIRKHLISRDDILVKQHLESWELEGSKKREKGEKMVVGGKNNATSGGFFFFLKAELEKRNLASICLSCYCHVCDNQS
jgi:hypothetical protein